MSANSTVIAARLFRSLRYMVLLIVTVFVSLLIITSVFARDYVSMSAIPEKVSDYYQSVKGANGGVANTLLDLFSGNPVGEDSDAEDAQIINEGVEEADEKDGGETGGKAVGETGGKAVNEAEKDVTGVAKLKEGEKELIDDKESNEGEMELKVGLTELKDIPKEGKIPSAEDTIESTNKGSKGSNDESNGAVVDETVDFQQ